MRTEHRTGRSRPRKRTVSLLAGVVAALLTACSPAAVPSQTAASPSSSVDSIYPLVQKNAWGSTELPSRPTRVAVVSGGDRDIAYALGLTPVTQPVYPGAYVSEYVGDAEKKLGITNPVSYDATDGTDFEAIAEADPEVILGVNHYSMDDDYAKLTKIAPVVTTSTKDEIDTLTWDARVRRVAEALGLQEKGEEVIAAARKVATDAAAEHPDWKGKTYTYVVVHPSQLTYASNSDADAGVFEDLGLVKAPNAKNYNAKKDAVSLENVDQFDADLLLISYPFGNEGVISRSALQSNKLWQAIPAVKDGRWGVVDAESGLASDVAYPSVLAYPWVVEKIVPLLVDAAAGKGGA
ncbi:MAG: ABC transporter substrate-binding protein [Micropruina sp.]|uniref:ABC transporter substrate-binding protein n=1 Tax=Micropruina sp. TaxID=2737536 RepID=UPI0039E51F9F